MWNRVTVKTPPEDVAVTTAEAKAFTDVTFSDDDTLIDSLVAAATAKFDGPNGIGIACITQTWELSLDCFTPEIILPGWPVKSVSEIRYTDTDGQAQTVGSFQLDIKGDKTRLRPAYNASWPSTRPMNGTVEIDYVVGEEQDDINVLLKLAIKQIVAHWYENREAASESVQHSIPMGAEQIMKDFMRGGIAS